MNNIKTVERKMINNSKLVAGESIPAARQKPSSMLVWDFSGLQLFWGQPRSWEAREAPELGLGKQLFSSGVTTSW